MEFLKVLDRLAFSRFGDVLLVVSQFLCLAVCVGAVYGVVVSIPERAYLDIFLTNPFAFLVSLILFVVLGRVRGPYSARASHEGIGRRSD